MAGEYYEGVGRRKTSVARVRLIPGGSHIVVNDKPADQYFGREIDRYMLLSPLVATGTQGQYSVSVKVEGGGITGQAEAVRMGVARALLAIDPNFRSALRQGGFLTRDARAKERKKPGLKRARKAPQYTKR
ncbi:MAG TPA: 30S ribosomal protein S9 [Anaerolineae bacterium]|nr:30S ribosomal protein S9 [Anaerolineae bacterium]